MRVSFVLLKTGTEVGWSVGALGDSSLTPNSSLA